jgi:signal transduction histidine kinase/CheY-like chemotaxis protein
VEAKERSYQELFERSPDAILIMEGDRFIDCNPAAVKMLRFPDKEALLERYSGSGSGALSAHPAEMSPPRQPDGRDSYEKAEEFLALTFERGSLTFEWTHVCADGEPLLVEVQLTVVRRGEKPVLHVVWRDISERKRLEAELRRAQRLEAVGRLAGGVAHDFNNLLVVILGNAELLEGEFASGKPDPLHIAEIRSAANRAAALTRQLLAFSSGQPVQSRATDLGDLVEQLGSMLSRLIGEHIELGLKRQDGPLTVESDPSQLEQIVVNLAANARDAMPHGGNLEISVERRRITPRAPMGHLPAGVYVALSVTDSGTGMTQEELDRAFDPFYTTKLLGKGTGLGLATVHAIAKQSGGQASIESTPGTGTRVQVLLPLSDREPVPLGEKPARQRFTGGGETILLVEDERAIRELFRRGLMSRGYQVLTAEDGEDALSQVAKWGKAIDLLVTDVVMPRVSGPELVQRLSASRPRLKVLYMSGYSQEGDLGVMSEVGRSAVLQKPFAPKALEAEIRRMLDEEPEESADPT